MATLRLGVYFLTALGVAAQIPAGDTCALATPVYDGVNPGAPSGTPGLTFSNVGAAADGPGLPDVWFSYTATTSGTATFSTCVPTGQVAGSADVRALEVFDHCDGALQTATERVCGKGAALSFVAVAGQTYRIRVYNANDGAVVYPGTFHVTIAYDVPTPSATCAGATPLPAAPFGLDFDPLAPTGDLSPPTCLPASAQTAWSQAWFAIAPGPARTLTMRSVGVASSLPGASVFLGADPIAVFDVSAGCASPALVSCSTEGYVQCALAAGATYAVRVTSFAAILPGRRSLVSARLDAPAAGDDCATAPPLALSLINNDVYAFVDFLGATSEPGASADMCAPGAVGVDYWRTLTLPFDCLVSLTWSYTYWAGATVAVFPAGCTATTPLACLTYVLPFSQTVSFAGTAGQTYLFRFSRPSLGAGTALSALALFCSPTPANDACANAIAVPFGDFGGAMLGATASPASLASSCGAAYASYRDVWFSFTAPATATHVIQAVASAPVVVPAPFVGVEIFTACGGASVACLPPTYPSTLGTLSTVAGTTYVVRIFAAASSSSTLTFALQFFPYLTNDSSAGAIEIVDGLNPSPPAGQSGDFFTMDYATDSTVPATNCPGSSNPATMGWVDAWFRFSAPSSGPRAFSLCTPPGFAAASSADLALRVYQGAPPSGVLVACADDDCGLLPRAVVTTVAGTDYYLLVERRGVSTPSPGAGFYVRVGPAASQAPGGAGCTGFVPTLAATTAVAGLSAALTLTTFSGDTAWIYGSADFDAALDLGAAQAGCVVHLDPPTLFEVAGLLVPGTAIFPTLVSVPLGILPPALVGYTFRFQALVVPGPSFFNAQFPAVFRLSNAVRTTIGY